MSKKELKLVKACLAGKTKQQEELYQIYSSQMFGVCLRYTNDYEQATEILQTGFIKVFTQLHQYQNKGSLGAWIRRIIVNNALDQIAKDKVYQFESIDTYDDDFYIATDDDIENILTEEIILEAISTLKEDYRVIFNLHCLEKYSHKEIGEMLGIPETTSRSQLRRARQHLKKILEESMMNISK